MPTTPLGIPYASLTDAPNGPSQQQSMATAIDTLITTDRTTLIQHGRVTVNPTANVYTPVAVTFPVAFSAAPEVTVTPIVAGSGSISGTGCDAPTTTGCNVGTVRTNTTATVLMWTAVGPR